jgi:NAD(P)-dependent dehydrogenase (short-subunit alcohol dehydrogenase family)
MSASTSQTIIITGAGAGIGRALAVGFTGRGAHVVAVGRSAAGLDQTKALCKSAGNVESHVLDVTDAAALEQLFAQIVRQRGGVDLLINNAAVYPHQLLGKMSAEEWSAGIATNLNGVVYGCRAAILTFPAARPAVVFNVGSFAYLGPDAGSTLYCTSKAAVGFFTRALAVELASSASPLIVNEWIPGVYRTQMSGNTGDDPTMAFERCVRAWELSKTGPGGRTFSGDQEVLPPRSKLSRLKSLLTGGRK